MTAEKSLPSTLITQDQYRSLLFCDGRGYTGNLLLFVDVEEQDNMVKISFLSEHDYHQWIKDVAHTYQDFGGCMSQTLLRIISEMIDEQILDEYLT